MDKEIYGRWFSVYRCSACKERLRRNVMMYSHGCCPHCGVKSGATIVDCDEGSARNIYTKRSFWFKKYKRHECKWSEK
jgi:hypothetical protein